MRGHAVVAGTFGIDTNVYGVGDRHGNEVTFARTSDGLGQAGCYSSRGFAALGVPTTGIAALGDDPLGRWVRDALESEGVRIVELRDPLGTHRSINLMAADGTRRNFYDARGAMDVTPDLDACRSALRGARVVHIHLENWCRRLLPIARDEGVVISCDLQDVLDLADPYRADFVAAADVLFMSGTNLADPASAARSLQVQRSGRVVVVGLGADGCLVAHDGTVDVFAAVDLPEPVIDTNGAGDSLAVGFLTAWLLDGHPIDRAARRAQIGARWICTQPGDAKAPITRARLDALD